ncbi:MAG: GDSL-type esterase/lipase family protein [Dysgonamonadaceae bacterium]|nr:GDSL-type esterase/lipase family protein [Dysgonamonadaceae bacterium]MDD3310033.1 GDSL-type esterase/lipase family protein [Dysgonamonadaceae bacterium]MDD3901532.1 GDSL-type esterase/lipase family protein [Dysgonamonadaceae bacterium]MDD4399575.1 GDSL-type esterase/lipase family protein [Dysgonamonadaceae bacterium]
MKFVARIILIFSFLLSFIGCASQKQLKEDYHTKFYTDRMAYFAANPLVNNQILFFGNSITQGGMWKSYFPDFDVVNRGIIGDNTEGMLARMDEICAAKPQKFFIMAGINDISQNRTNKEIIANYRDIISILRAVSPHTEIYIQSVLPINNDFAKYKRLIGKEQQIVDLNNQLKLLAYQKHITFINIFPLYAGADGRLKKELTSDGLHLKPQAYNSWVNIINNYVKD